MYTGQNVFDELQARHNIAFVQDIRDRIAIIEKREVRSLEMRQMADMLIVYRNKMRRALDDDRAWKTVYEAATE